MLTKITVVAPKDIIKTRHSLQEMMKKPGIYQTHPDGAFRFIVPIPGELISVYNKEIKKVDMETFKYDKFVLVDEEITLNFKN